MRCGYSLHAKAANLLGMEIGYKSAASLLDVPIGTVGKSHCTYRVLDKGALFVAKRKTRPFELKLAVVREFLQGELIK